MRHPYRVLNVKPPNPRSVLTLNQISVDLNLPFYLIERVTNLVDAPLAAKGIVRLGFWPLEVLSLI